MCGILGSWGKLYPEEEFKNNLDLLYSRGPDERGMYCSHEHQLQFGHRRLSILDLSSNGAQPMHSCCGRYVITYNGEIYNHIELRNHIKSHYGFSDWKGHSDTETLVNLIKFAGINKTLNLVEGMFAFGVYDKKNKSLYLARDRIGEKPLYYGKQNSRIVFSSELKSFESLNDWNLDLDMESVSMFLQLGYIPAPKSIYKNIYKLMPAHYIKIQDDSLESIAQEEYWNLNEEIKNKTQFFKDKSYKDLLSISEEKLIQSVSGQMISDVPIGSFLSGGTDSSLISAIMQSLSSNPIDTFTVSFEDKAYNEASIAKKVSSHIGSNYNELVFQSSDALSTIPSLARIYDEPFADISQLPTILLSKFARNKVKVCLSGDGGDEIHCGYNRYLGGYESWKKVNFLPVRLKDFLDKQIFSRAIRVAPRFRRRGLNFLFSEKNLIHITKFQRVLSATDIYEYYKNVMLSSNDVDDLLPVKKSIRPEFPISKNTFNNFSVNDEEKLMISDIKLYLPNDILTKTDRASMFSSLEVRVPFLDSQFLSNSMAMPLTFKKDGSSGKNILKDILYKYVPKKYFSNKKSGFSVPMSNWLRNDLNDWASALLSKDKIKNSSLLNYESVNNIWMQHCSERYNHEQILWNILILQSWLEGKK